MESSVVCLKQVRGALTNPNLCSREANVLYRPCIQFFVFFFLASMEANKLPLTQKNDSLGSSRLCEDSVPFGNDYIKSAEE